MKTSRKSEEMEYDVLRGWGKGEINFFYKPGSITLAGFTFKMTVSGFKCVLLDEQANSAKPPFSKEKKKKNHN